MGATHGLGIAGAIIGALAALIFVDIAVALPALFAVGAGIALIVINRDAWQGWAPGAAAALFGILGILGTLENVSTEDGGVSFGITAAWGQAFVVIACIELAGSAIYRGWSQLQPWMAWTSVAVRALAAILALVFRSDLSNQQAWPAFVIALLVLLSMIPVIQLRRA